MGCTQPLFELLNQTTSFVMTSWIQIHNDFGKDRWRWRHSCHDMRIYELKISYGHLSYRANRIMNRKTIQGDGTMSKIAIVLRTPWNEEFPSERPWSKDFLDKLNTSKEHFSPNGPLAVRTPRIDLNSFSDVVHSSYASDAFKVECMYCKACSLGNLGLRSSDAKNSKVFLSFLQRIHKEYM